MMMMYCSCIYVCMHAGLVQKWAWWCLPWTVQKQIHVIILLSSAGRSGALTFVHVPWVYLHILPINLLTPPLHPSFLSCLYVARLAFVFVAAQIWDETSGVIDTDSQGLRLAFYILVSTTTTTTTTPSSS